MTPAERADLADLEREMTALEAASKAWVYYRAVVANVEPPTPQERAELDALLKETLT